MKNMFKKLVCVGLVGLFVLGSVGIAEAKLIQGTKGRTFVTLDKIEIQENKMVLDEFEIIDKNIDLINEIKDLDKIEPMSHCLDDFVYELREDVIEESIPIEDLLKNCDKTKDREVKVPKVVQ